MKSYIYTYSDSVAGFQSERFNKLSEIVKYIEDFDHEGEETSVGIIYENENPILMYVSSPDSFNWQNYTKFGINELKTINMRESDNDYLNSELPICL